MWHAYSHFRSQIAAMTDDPGQVRNPRRDKRVTDVERFLHDRRNEAMKMMAFWERSKKPYAADELAYWTGVLHEVDRQAAMPADGAD